MPAVGGAAEGSATLCKGRRHAGPPHSSPPHSRAIAASGKTLAAVNTADPTPPGPTRSAPCVVRSRPGTRECVASAASALTLVLREAQ